MYRLAVSLHISLSGLAVSEAGEARCGYDLHDAIPRQVDNYLTIRHLIRKGESQIVNR